STYDHAARWGITPQSDQGIAGSVMMIVDSVVTISAIAWLFLRLAGESELKQKLIEEGHDPALASRAVRYGRGEELASRYGSGRGGEQRLAFLDITLRADGAVEGERFVELHVGLGAATVLREGPGGNEPGIRLLGDRADVGAHVRRARSVAFGEGDGCLGP